MITKKIGSQLVFYLDDCTTVKYDLATQQTIGKRGKPVQCLTSQLSGISASTIIESIEQEGYRNFLKWVQEQGCRRVSNFGTILELAKIHTRYEQYFSAGIPRFVNGFSVNVTDIPKGLLKLVRENNITLTKDLYTAYLQYPDAFTLLTKESYNSMTISDGIHLLCRGMSCYSWGEKKPEILRMSENWGYNIKALLQYIDNIMTYEAMGWLDALQNIYDYAKMMSDLSPKFDKYPRYLHTTHDIAVRNYGRLKEKHDAEKFAASVRPEYDTKIGDYIFLCAKTPQDIKDEAVQQNNCVASYISRVSEGRCHIVFMRHKESPDKSCITLEIRDNEVVQSRGRFNRDLTYNEKAMVQKYNSYLKKLGEDKQ